VADDELLRSLKQGVVRKLTLLKRQAARTRLAFEQLLAPPVVTVAHFHELGDPKKPGSSNSSDADATKTMQPYGVGRVFQPDDPSRQDP
jgi:hypothetical protein